MSRTDDGGEGYENFPNEWAFWEHRLYQVLGGKPGRKQLAKLREALLALPEKRLISRALSTAGKAEAHANDRYSDYKDLIAEQGVGVCAVGAFVWHRKVENGADPTQAMIDLPLVPDIDGESYLTPNIGESAGLGRTLSWDLMQRNDSTYSNLSPEARYTAFLDWIDRQLAAPLGTVVF